MGYFIAFGVLSGLWVTALGVSMLAARRKRWMWAHMANGAMFGFSISMGVVVLIHILGYF